MDSVKIKASEIYDNWLSDIDTLDPDWLESLHKKARCRGLGRLQDIMAQRDKKRSVRAKLIIRQLWDEAIEQAVNNPE